MLIPYKWNNGIYIPINGMILESADVITDVYPPRNKQWLLDSRAEMSALFRLLQYLHIGV